MGIMMTPQLTAAISQRSVPDAATGLCLEPEAMQGFQVGSSAFLIAQAL
jgi:hypothetical protein